jgi:hypothetical protein
LSRIGGVYGGLAWVQLVNFIWVWGSLGEWDAHDALHIQLVAAECLF